MEENRIVKKIELAYSLALALIAFLTVLLPKMVALGFILMFLTLIWAGFKKQIKFTLHPVLVGFVLFYLAYVVGSFFTNNPQLAGNYLEYKLSFILFPILFSFRPKFEIKQAYAVLGLVAGTTGVTILGVLKGISIYVKTEYLFGSFTASSICIDYPTYYAAAVLISLVGVFYFYRLKVKEFTRSRVISYSVFAIVMIFLSYSMAAILFLILLIAFVTLKWMFLTFNKWLTLAVVLISPLMLFFFLNSVPAFKDEINNSSVAFKDFIADPNEYVKGTEEYTSGDKVRLVMWTVSASEFSKHPMGVGTGNVDEVLSGGLLEIGQYDMATKNVNNEIVYNPHNQFLQTGLKIGLIGLFILVFILFKSIQIGYKQKNWFLIVVVFSLIFNSIFESMLQRQSGIVLYTFFICLLSISPLLKDRKPEEPH